MYVNMDAYVYYINVLVLMGVSWHALHLLYGDETAFKLILLVLTLKGLRFYAFYIDYP